MVKLKLELAQGLQAIDLNIVPRWVALPATMQVTVKEGAKVASTVKITVRSQAEVDRLLAQDVIVVGKTLPVDRYHNIAPDTQCTTCAKWGHIMLHCPNSEQAYCFLYAGSHLTKNRKYEVHGCSSKKGKACTYTIAKCCNCDGKYFASASACPKCQRAIESAKTGKADWRE